MPAFYRGLFESRSVAEGVRAGRQQMLSQKKRMSAGGPYEFEDWLLPVLYQQAALDFEFAAQPDIIKKPESRLPQEVLGVNEEYGFIGRDGPILEMERALHRRAPCILVRGLGGVGETTLARGFLRWLDETGGLDAALWFDFRDIRSAEYVLNRTGALFYGEGEAGQPASCRHELSPTGDDCARAGRLHDGSRVVSPSGVTEGELAEAALDVLAENPEFAEPIRVQTRIGFKMDHTGKWSRVLDKKAGSDSS